MIQAPRISIGSVSHPLQHQLRQPAGRVVPRGFVEGVVIGLANAGLDRLGTINRQVVAQVIGEDAQVVQAEKMVGVLVRIDYGVDQPNLLAQQLHAKIRGGVDKQVSARQAPYDTAPPALVLRMRVQARRAATADHGHAVRSAGAEKNKLIQKIPVDLQCGHGGKDEGGRMKDEG